MNAESRARAAKILAVVKDREARGLQSVVLLFADLEKAGVLFPHGLYLGIHPCGKFMILFDLQEVKSALQFIVEAGK